MLFSESKKFVFIAVPRTGTTSIELEMRRLDPTILRNEMVYPDGEIRTVNKHITLRDVQDILGSKAEEYAYYAFVREPIDHTISRYYYYATGRGRQRLKDRAVSSHRIRALRLRVWFARLMPRPLWFVFYPVKLQSSFVSDADGRYALDFCGSLEHIDRDLSAMLLHAGYRDVDARVEHVNSAPRDAIGRVERRFIVSVLKRRLKPDLDLFKTLLRHG